MSPTAKEETPGRLGEPVTQHQAVPRERERVYQPVGPGLEFRFRWKIKYQKDEGAFPATGTLRGSGRAVSGLGRKGHRGGTLASSWQGQVGHQVV